MYIPIASTRFSKAAASFTISEVGLGCLKEAWKKKNIKKKKKVRKKILQKAAKETYPGGKENTG